MSLNLRLNDDSSDSDDDVFKNASSYQAEGPRLVGFQGPSLDFAAAAPVTETKKPSGGLLGLLGIQVGNNEEIDKKWKERQTNIQIKDSVRRLQALDLDLGGGGSDDDDDDEEESYTDRRLDRDMDGSYDITDNGTLKISNFSVRRNNRRANSLIENISQDDLIEIGSLGAGAGGNVVKCLHKPTGVIVALKSIDVTDKGKRDQLVRELKELEAGDSSYLVGMHNLFFSDGQLHIALEYMDRGSLQSVVEKAGKLHEHVLADIARQMMLGLMHMHSLRKIHRDIKPGNVLVNKFGEVKISDFGIMAQLDTGKDNCNTFVGTTVYMSPERIDSLSYSYPGDIWSAGLTLMFCATGSLPISTHGGYWAIFQRLKNEPSPELGPEYSEDLRDFVAKCLIKDPAQRWDAISLLMHPFIQNKSLGPRRTIPYWPAVLQMQAKEDVRGNSNMNNTIKNLSQARDQIRQMQQQQPYQYQYPSSQPATVLSQQMAAMSLHGGADVDYEKTQLAPPQQMQEQAQHFAQQTYLPPSNYAQQQQQAPRTSVPDSADEYLVTQVSGEPMHARPSVSATKPAVAPLASSSSAARLSISAKPAATTTSAPSAAASASASAGSAAGGSNSFLLKCRTSRQSTSTGAPATPALAPAAAPADVKRTTTSTSSASAADPKRRVSEAARPTSGYARTDTHPTMTRSEAASSSSLLRARASSSTTTTTAPATPSVKPTKPTVTTTTSTSTSTTAASRPTTARPVATTTSTTAAPSAVPRKSTSVAAAGALGDQDDPFANAFALAGSPLKYKRPGTASNNVK